MSTFDYIIIILFTSIVVAAGFFRPQTINKIKFKEPITTTELSFAVRHPSANIPAAIFEILVLN